MPSPVRHIKPFLDRLYIRTFVVPERITEAGIIAPVRGQEAETERSMNAIILATGTHCSKCAAHGSAFEVGQFIRVARFSGTVIFHDNLGDPDIYYSIIREDAVLCWEDRAGVMRDLSLTEEDVAEIVAGAIPSTEGALAGAT